MPSGPRSSISSATISCIGPCTWRPSSEACTRVTSTSRTTPPSSRNSPAPSVISASRSHVLNMLRGLDNKFHHTISTITSK
jgi:hypothetical protein